MYQKYGETKSELLIHYDNGWFTLCGIESTCGVILTKDKTRVTCKDCKGVNHGKDKSNSKIH